MARRGFFSSLLIAIVVAVLTFFIVYFFFPSFSERFLGMSWKLQQTGLTYAQNAEVKEMSRSIETMLQDSGLSKKQIKSITDQLKSPEVRSKVASALAGGKDVLVDVISGLQ